MAIRFRRNKVGFDTLRTSGAVQAMVDDIASRMSSAANVVPSTTEPAATEPYYQVQDATDGQRARRRVATTGPRAAAHERKTQALQRAL